MSILSELSQHSGTEHYYRAPFTKRGVYTDGVKHMAEIAEAHWLITAVFSYIPKLDKMGDHFYPVRLEKEQDAWYLRIGDADNPEKITQRIEYSDFPEDMFKMYLALTGTEDETFWVLMLPGEY